MFDRPRTLAVMTSLCISLSYDASAKADIIIQTPPGLIAGDTFRIAFVSDATTEATSSDISYYNTFVNNDAIAEAGGGNNEVTYDGAALTFSAIASASTTNAIDNITGTASAPLYLVNGTLVASSLTVLPGGLWSEYLLAPIDLDLTGANLGTTGVWTGTSPNGIVGYALGGAGATYGISTSTTPSWITAGLDTDIRDPNHVYGVSNLLTVLTAIPEPSSLILLTIGEFGLLVYGSLRRSQGRD